MSDNDTTIDDEMPDNEETTTGKKGVNLLRHTATIDKLVLKNKELQRQLDDAEDEINYLSQKLKDNSIKISKNLFYIGLIVAGFLLYTGNNHLTMVNNRIVEMKVAMESYKAATEKTEAYNIMLERKLGIKPTE